MLRRAQRLGAGSSPTQQLHLAVERVVASVADDYSRACAGYSARYGSLPSQADLARFGALLGEVRRRLVHGELDGPRERWSLLDVGAGPGRDLAYLYAHFPEVSAVGAELCPAFIDLLRRRHIDGEIGEAPIVADMRTLSGIADESFECVRHNATLHHLPVLWRGLGADQAIDASHRVLKPGGVLAVLVKNWTVASSAAG